MKTTIFRQYDPRWRALPYPGKGYKLNGSGCGCVAVTHCVIENPKYSNYTPANVQPYMKKWAVCGDGTKRVGITDGLKHFGLTDVVRLGSAPMTTLWAELEKGSRVGVLLFGGRKGPDGTRWTTGGHYIAFTGYKVQGGQHWLYLKDSGSRKHDGWFSYERSMRGDVLDAWSAKVPAEQKKDAAPQAYTGIMPYVGGGSRMISFARSQKGKYPTRSHGGKDGKKYHNKFTLYFKGKGGINSKGEMPAVYGYIPGYCTLFACYCLDRTGQGNLVPFKELNSKKNGYWWHAPSLMKWYRKKGYLVTSASKAKKGAIAFKGSKSPTHTCIFDKYEGGWVYTWDGNVGGGVTYNRRKASAFCGFANLPLKDYFGLGSYGIDVLRWQKYLNWYNDSLVVAEDSGFGQDTKDYTILFQKENGLTPDGTVGAKTVLKGKEVKR